MGVLRQQSGGPRSHRPLGVRSEHELEVWGTPWRRSTSACRRTCRGRGKTVFTGVFKDPVTGPRRVRQAQRRRRRAGRPRRARRRAARRVRLPARLLPVLGARARPRRLRLRGSSARTSRSRGWPTTRSASATATGSAPRVFEVTQPRVTCYRVGIRMNDPRIPALLVSHRRPGFYFRVLEEGDVEAGDEIVKLASGPEEMTVAEVDGAALPARASAPAAAPGAAHPGAEPRAGRHRSRPSSRGRGTGTPASPPRARRRRGPGFAGSPSRRSSTRATR